MDRVLMSQSLRLGARFSKGEVRLLRSKEGTFLAKKGCRGRVNRLNGWAAETVPSDGVRSG